MIPAINPFLKKKECIEKETERVRHVMVNTGENVQSVLKEIGSTPLNSGASLAELIRRPECNYENLARLDEMRQDLPKDVREQVNINCD